MGRRKRKKQFPASDFFNQVKARGIRRKKTIKRILLALVFGFLTYRFFSGPYGFVQIHSLWKEKRSLEKESRMLEAEIVDLELEKRRLTEDDFYLEKQARERLRMIREGEKLYQVIDYEKAKQAQEKKTPQPSPPDSASP